MTDETTKELKRESKEIIKWTMRRINAYKIEILIFTVGFLIGNLT
jgi:hypothetical protein